VSAVAAAASSSTAAAHVARDDFFPACVLITLMVLNPVQLRNSRAREFRYK
jgi:hypothetical protein